MGELTSELDKTLAVRVIIDLKCLDHVFNATSENIIPEILPLPMLF